MVYQPNIPTGLINLDVDYRNLRDNFQQLDTSFGIDHLPFSNTTGQNGYHTVVHLLANSTVASNAPNNQPITPVAPVALTGEIFTAQINDGFGVDTALHYQSAGGFLTQMTRNFLPHAGNNGYTFIPGGLVLQWGIVTAATTPNAFPAATGNVSFAVSNKIFPNNCFNVQCTLIAKAGGSVSDFTIGVITSTVSTTGFNWSYSGSTSTGYPSFFWLAIGN